VFRIEKSPKTLGDKLLSQKPVNVFKIIYIMILSALAGFLTYWVSENIELAIPTGVLCGMALGFVAVISRQRKTHFLFTSDKQRFMRHLKLANKTAIFDGNNIYHFGLHNDLGVTALAHLIAELRADGFRIICFFDANIFFTLQENGDFAKGRERFSVYVLERIFGLKHRETYVVPSGQQADHFIVETLSHLPIAFAVTNDRFKDYASHYDFLTKDKMWRKGVTMKKGKLLLDR
jgi:hypothetical protein